ncbi:hypothetical protein N7539_003562 [Penicillium diatomitis]|uniref:Uncharacterized protein n=1 Tax=Penicillium diatomitis TaxID=2819901 RepID=A0A9W9XCD3_9EURO|nr:uncharacterized protein N7539_003562 [Penicillium diatomitis]KAJ5488672.1 hypothetical protein N7539_003562 [Penicillium diatomitis]
MDETTAGPVGCVTSAAPPIAFADAQPPASRDGPGDTAQSSDLQGQLHPDDAPRRNCWLGSIT